MLSPSFTVKVNTWFLSAALSLISSLLSSRSPVLRVFVKAATHVVPLIVPVSPVHVVVNSSSSASVTVYLIPFGRPEAFFTWLSFRSKVATPFSNVISP